MKTVTLYFYNVPDGDSAADLADFVQGGFNDTIVVSQLPPPERV